jgi:hypothetical protein
MTKKLRLLLDSRPLFKWHRIDIVVSLRKSPQDAFVRFVRLLSRV